MATYNVSTMADLRDYLNGTGGKPQAGQADTIEVAAGEYDCDVPLVSICGTVHGEDEATTIIDAQWKQTGSCNWSGFTIDATDKGQIGGGYDDSVVIINPTTVTINHVTVSATTRTGLGDGLQIATNAACVATITDLSIGGFAQDGLSFLPTTPAVGATCSATITNLIGWDCGSADNHQVITSHKNWALTIVNPTITCTTQTVPIAGDATTSIDVRGGSLTCGTANPQPCVLTSVQTEGTIRVRGVTMTTSHADTTGAVYCSGAGNYEISGCAISCAGATAQGVLLDQCTGTVLIQNNTISAYLGITTATSCAAAVAVYGNTLTPTGLKAAMQCSGTGTWIVKGNRIIVPAGGRHGIQSTGVGARTIENNLIISPSIIYPAIHLTTNQTGDVRIVNNTLAGKCGLWVDNANACNILLVNNAITCTAAADPKGGVWDFGATTATYTGSGYNVMSVTPTNYTLQTGDVVATPALDAKYLPTKGGNCDVGKGDPTVRSLGTSDCYGRPKLHANLDCVGAVYPQRKLVGNLLLPPAQWADEVN